MECQYITDNSGVPVSVVIPISTWELIQKQLKQKVKQKSLYNTKAGNARNPCAFPHFLVFLTETEE